MNNTLVIGTGGCGNKLMNVFISLLNNRDELHASYDGIFVNSNKNEMEILDNCDLQRNALVINGDGTGRNASKAKKSIALDRVKVMNYFARIIDKYQSAIIMTSLDGGFGNGSVDIITKILKQLNPDIKIFLLGASAKLKSKKISLENTLSLYEDIKELMEIGQIDSYMFIDNDKMEDEDEFNIRTMSLFLGSLELGEEALDSNDSLLVNFAKGYKMILPLSNKFNSVKDAIDDAIKKSPFVLPNRIKCTHIYGTYNSDDYSEQNILSEYNITDFDKLVSSDNTFLVLNGFADPDKHMATLNTAYELLDCEEDEDEGEEFTFSKKKTVKTEPKAEKKSKKQRLRSMMDDSFWS